MKFKWKKWLYLITTIILFISSLGFTISSIYSFTKNQMQNPTNDKTLPAPIFSQSEINQISTNHGIKMDTFKTLVRQKTPAQLTHFYTNEKNNTWLVKVNYSFINQSGVWIYELKYD